MSQSQDAHNSSPKDSSSDLTAAHHAQSATIGKHNKPNVPVSPSKPSDDEQRPSDVDMIEAPAGVELPWLNRCCRGQGEVCAAPSLFENGSRWVGWSE